MEEIIIDDVNVAGCKDYFAKIEYIDTSTGDCQMKHFRDFCKNQPDCYYKQLQHKEKECEELKRENEHKDLEIQDWIKQYKLAHQKRIKLQTKYNKLEQKANKYIHDLVDEQVKDISNISKECNSLEKQNAKLKQALQEIKEIAEENIEICEKCKKDTDNFIEELDCFEMVCQYRPLRDCSDKILQKISEVENE